MCNIPSTISVADGAVLQLMVMVIVKLIGISVYCLEFLVALSFLYLQVSGLRNSLLRK